MQFISKLLKPSKCFVQSILRQPFGYKEKMHYIIPNSDQILLPSSSFMILTAWFSKQNMVQPLTPEERKTHLESLFNNSWTYIAERDAIKKRFAFKNFYQAFGFMTQVAMAAEKANHHPEWSNVYNHVDVIWTTHSCNGLTQKDIKLANFCDRVSKQTD